jgi:hypothetical protein
MPPDALARDPAREPGWDDLTVAAAGGTATIYDKHEVVTPSGTIQPASFVHQVDFETGRSSSRPIL